jgi:hypothetical protein
MIPPNLLDTPSQRAIWDRMKAENSVGYQQIKYNTTWNRYADYGRWEMLAAVIDKDQTLALKSFEETKAATNAWQTVWTSNESREHTIELAIRYGCLYPYLSDAQRNEYRVYMVAVAEGIIKALRPNDSDQATGNYFGLALIDKVLGTQYLEGTFTNPSLAAALNPFPVGGLTGADTINGKESLRGYIRRYFSTFGEGGSWPESSDYNIGTTWLALTGAYYTGLEHFPEAKTWLVERVKTMLFELTPDLLDSHQFGDVQNVRVLRLNLDYIDLWTLWQGVLDAIGETDLAAQMRQFEADVYAANKITAVNPVYARYYYTQNPYGAKAPWRTDGVHVQTGLGMVTWRSGKTSGSFHAPNFLVGTVDHFQAWGGGDLRVRQDGKWLIDHPLGYAPDQRFLNTVLINGSGPGQEMGGLVASTYIPGTLVHAAGVSAGTTPLVYPNYGTQVGTDGTVPYTTTHENLRNIVQLLDGPDLTVLIADRVHADDAKLEKVTNTYGTFDWTKIYSYSNQQNIINTRIGITDWVWHTKTEPTITEHGFSADGVTVTRLLPEQAVVTVVNEALDQNNPAAVPHGYCVSPVKAGCLSGYFHAAERKWAIHEVPTEHQAFRLHLHVVSTGNVTATQIPAPDGVWLRVSRPNLPDVAVFFSSKVGPRIKTSTAKNPSGSSRVIYDPTKFEAVKQGRIVTTKAPPPTGTVAYYADMGDTLIAAEEPTAPPCTFTEVDPTSVEVEAAGANVLITVTKSDPACVVPVTTDVTWITSAHTPDGVLLEVDPNADTEPRVGIATVAGVAVTVNQAAEAVVEPPAAGQCLLPGGTTYPIGADHTVYVLGSELEETIDSLQKAGWLVTGVLPDEANYVVRLICLGA